MIRPVECMWTAEGLIAAWSCMWPCSKPRGSKPCHAPFSAHERVSEQNGEAHSSDFEFLLEIFCHKEGWSCLQMSHGSLSFKTRSLLCLVNVSTKALDHQVSPKGLRDLDYNLKNSGEISPNWQGLQVHGFFCDAILPQFNPRVPRWG